MASALDFDASCHPTVVYFVSPFEHSRTYQIPGAYSESHHDHRFNLDLTPQFQNPETYVARSVNESRIRPLPDVKEEYVKVEDKKPPGASVCPLCTSKNPVQVPAKFMIGHISHHLNYLPVKCLTCHESFGSLAVYNWHATVNRHSESYSVNNDYFLESLVGNLHNVIQSLNDHTDPSLDKMEQLYDSIDRFPANLKMKSVVRTLVKITNLISPFLRPSRIFGDNNTNNFDSVILPVVEDWSHNLEAKDVVQVSSCEISQDYNYVQRHPANEEKPKVPNEIDRSSSETVPPCESNYIYDMLYKDNVNQARSVNRGSNRALMTSFKQESIVELVDISYSDDETNVDRSRDQLLTCDVCAYSTRKPSKLHSHIRSTKHKLMSKVIKKDLSNIAKKRLCNSEKVSEGTDKIIKYSCGLCSFFSKQRKYFLQHLRTKRHLSNIRTDPFCYNKITVKCDVCNDKVNFDAYYSHLYVKHSIRNINQIRANRRSKIQARRAVREDGATKPSKATSSSTKNAGYNYDETGAVGFQFECNQCRSLCGDRDAIKRHVKTHKTVKVFECRNCSSQFNRNYFLKRHLRWNKECDMTK